MGTAPTNAKNTIILKASWIDTKIGPMITIADDKGIYLLEFVDRRGLEKKVEKLRQKKKAAIIPDTNDIIHSIEKELSLYFEGKLPIFKTPLHCIGSPFQKMVWKALQEIPYGQTKSYLDIAKIIDNPLACRAVALANGANQIAIVIPCHRVINNNGALGGYGGGLIRKEWLLNHEKNSK